MIMADFLMCAGSAPARQPRLKDPVNALLALGPVAEEVAAR